LRDRLGEVKVRGGEGHPAAQAVLGREAAVEAGPHGLEGAGLGVAEDRRERGALEGVLEGEAVAGGEEAVTPLGGGPAVTLGAGPGAKWQQGRGDGHGEGEKGVN
jgi:hypothetical protein